jgi:hypothetical protein
VVRKARINPFDPYIDQMIHHDLHRTQCSARGAQGYLPLHLAIRFDRFLQQRGRAMPGHSAPNVSHFAH